MFFCVVVARRLSLESFLCVFQFCLNLGGRSGHRVADFIFAAVGPGCIAITVQRIVGADDDTAGLLRPCLGGKTYQRDHNYNQLQRKRKSVHDAAPAFIISYWRLSVFRLLSSLCWWIG